MPFRTCWTPATANATNPPYVEPARRVGRPRTNPTECTHVENGAKCGTACASKGLCAKHYAQSRRKRLGKTRPKARDGEGAVVKVFIGKSLKEKIEKLAKKEKKSVSLICAAALALAIQ